MAGEDSAARGYVRKIGSPAFAFALALGLSGCVTVNNYADEEEVAEQATPDHPEAAIYAVTENPMAEVDAALARAAERDARLLLVMGANWCHDSRGLAGWLETERFADMVSDHYELVYVNIGMPQTGDAHNLDIAQRFGVEQFNGTPALLVVTPEGMLVNPDTATTWRNAASRDEDAIYEELHRLAHQPAGMIMPTPGIEIAE